ncbi:MAG: hypothetical protein ACFE95_08280 [Candidatus Hodarchaeota archaeon]
MRSNGKQRQNEEKNVMATVYLKSTTGRSLLEEDKAVIDPKPFLPSPETTQRAIAELKKRGFTIEAQGITLSVSGPPELFKKIFDVKITIEKIKSHDLEQTQPQTWLIYRSSKPIMQIAELEDIIEGIVLSTPGIPFK